MSSRDIQAKLNSCIYQGKTFHKRFMPTQHSFDYSMYMLWLDLDELELLDEKLSRFSINKFNWLSFKRSDYLGNPEQSLKASVLEKASELAKKTISGKVYLLGNLRCFGIYFSPVNFYYIQSETGAFSHVLAEVSNTPWNKRHCYLVDLATQQDCQKQFHVSPFNPLEMQYQWNIGQPSSRLSLWIKCKRESKEFAAGIKFTQQPLNQHSLNRVLTRTPWITVKIVAGIYWQALKLFIKGTPYYPYKEPTVIQGKDVYEQS